MLYPHLDFELVLIHSQTIFTEHRQKYGDAFFELSSLSLSCLADSRAQRVKTLLKQGSNTGAVGEPLEHSLYGVINYSLLNIIFQDNGNSWEGIKSEQVLPLYESAIESLQELYLAKTKDYNEQWRRIPAIALIEIILMKLRRIEALYSHNPATNTVHELQDIINYAIFATILVGERKE